MEKIEPGKYVELTYDLYTINADGKEQLVHQSDSQDPERFVFGVTPGLVPALEKELPGKAEGDEYDVVAQKAFGDFDPEAVVELEKEVFEVDGKFDDEMIKVGGYVPLSYPAVRIFPGLTWTSTTRWPVRTYASKAKSSPYATPLPKNCIPHRVAAAAATATAKAATAAATAIATNSHSRGFSATVSRTLRGYKITLNSHLI